MKQVVQDIRNGRTSVMEVPDPVVGRHKVLVAMFASVISAGTERYVVELASRSLIGKARARPDHVRRIFEKIRQEGLGTTIQQVRGKLSEPMPMGYSGAGVVLECGDGVHEFKPGDRVAAAGPHAGIVAVSRNLCAKLPDGVSFESAAYTPIAAIALQGVRLAQASLGETVVVIGLGLIGQITVALLKAQGCRVFGIDLDPERAAVARALGCDQIATGDPITAVNAFSDGLGVDAVIIAASTSSNGPIELAAEVCRPKARIVLVGVTGLELPRAPFFKKELEFTVSSSMGAGRGDPIYEERGVDYPIGYARWTARRNMETVVDLMGKGQLPVERLTTHRFLVDDAADAYEQVLKPASLTVGVVLEHARGAAAASVLTLEARANDPRRECRISVLGAGNFARLVLLPNTKRLAGVSLRGICSAGGLNAQQSAKEHRFEFSCSDPSAILSDPATDAVIIATRHDVHADLVVQALAAGKHVFVEKPLALNEADVDRIGSTLASLRGKAPILMVGFNRRFAPGIARVSAHFDGVLPRTVVHRFVTGSVPLSSWVQDPDQGGGRIIGEACHAIDTCTYLAGALPVRVFAESVRSRDAREASDDQACITLRHNNGSVSTIIYQAAGDPAGPRERIEVFGGGRTAVLDGWVTGELWSGQRRTRFSGKRDRGHNEELAAFVAAVVGRRPSPIAWAELAAVTRASLAVVRSLRTGLPVDVD